MKEPACLWEGERRWALEGTAWTLGRQAPAELVFPYPQISRCHARLEFVQGGYWLRDMGSRYGTFCQGVEVKGDDPTRLRDGDELVLGGVLALRFSDPGDTREGRRVGRLRGLWVDPGSLEVWVDGQNLSPALSTAQLGLLQLLLRREGEFFSRDEVCLALWPDECQEGISEEALDGLVKRVRGRLRELGGDGYLEVKRGRGLRLRKPT